MQSVLFVKEALVNGVLHAKYMAKQHIAAIAVLIILRQNNSIKDKRD